MGQTDAIETLKVEKGKMFQQMMDGRVNSNGEGMVAQLLELIETQKAEIVQLKREVMTLQSERKEQEEVIAQLREQIGANGDGKALYLEWKAENVLEWILSLENGVFMQYEDDLTQKVMTDDVTGAHLEALNLGTVRELGVKRVTHQQLLLRAIAKLMDKNDD